MLHAGDLGIVGRGLSRATSVTSSTGQSNPVSSSLYYYEHSSQNLTFDDMIGRAIVVHAGVDGGSGAFCDQAGSSGARLFHCVVGLRHSNLQSFPDLPTTEFENAGAVTFTPTACPAPPTAAPSTVPDAEYWDASAATLTGSLVTRWRDSGACDDESAFCADRVARVALGESLTLSFDTNGYGTTTARWR